MEITVNFPQKTEDSLLKYAVIIAIFEGRYVFVRHKERSTFEIPGGHREINEDIVKTARRELWEETGAESFSLCRLCPYSVTKNGITDYGMLFYSEIERLGKLPDKEIAEIILVSDPNEISDWTYPLIQPLMFGKFSDMLNNRRNL